MKLIEILAINLRYYRMKHNLSQEKFAEILGTSLSYLNQRSLFKSILWKIDYIYSLAPV